ncbi:MAG: hypothetical protein ACOCM1_05445, partial [Segatella copri]
SCLIATTVAISSTIPLNIIFFFVFKLIFAAKLYLFFESPPDCSFFFAFLPPFSLHFQRFIVPLHKKSCTRQIESKLSLRSFAFSLHIKIRGLE